jgi:hypothetical protein
MLKSRNIIATLSGEILRASGARECPQGGIHSHLFWSLIVDDLWGLNSNGNYTVGYAEDIAILINGKFLQSVSEILQTALCTVQQWYERRNLSITLNKTVIISFTRKRNIKVLKEPTFFWRTILLSSEFKYLGITQGRGLTWKKQMNKVINRSYKAFWTCCSTFGKTCRLQRKVIFGYTRRL